MNRCDFLINWYYKEKENKIILDNSLSIPIGVLTGFIAIFYYMFINFTFDSGFLIKISFIVFFSIGLLCWIFSAFFLLESYNKLFKGYFYEELPSASELNTYYEKVQEYFKKNKKILDKETTVDTLYEQEMIKLLSKCIDTNVESNNYKTKFMYLSKVFLFGCVISTMISTIPFVIEFLK